MFGNLFEDGSNMACRNAKSVLSINGKPIEQPPEERGEQSLIGIQNQGATCYLNSLIQTLFLTPEFREQLFDIGCEELGKSGPNKKDGKVRKIPLQLQLLFARLLLINQSSCKTEDLTDSFGWRNSEEMQQHDVQELSRILFDAIENSLVGTSGDKLIHNLYKGVIVNQIQCCICQRVSERDEEFLDLTVSVSGGKNLQSSLSSVFQAEEMMSGKNQYFCEKCKKLVNAKKGAKLKTLPPILTLSLLRFNYDLRTFNRYKETGHFPFPIKLNVEKYCKQHNVNGDGDGTDKDKPPCTEYSLYSVIIHTGNAHRGHYHAYIRDVDGLEKAKLPIVDPEPDFEMSTTTSKAPTMVVVQKRSEPVNPNDNIEETLACLIAQQGSVKLDQLSMKLRYETGISWNKKYRKKHGSLSKFLLSCPNTFVVDNENNSVYLCSQPSEDSNQKLITNQLENINGSQQFPEALNHSMINLSLEEKDEKIGLFGGTNDVEEDAAPTSPDLSTDAGSDNKETAVPQDVNPAGHSWFDFNDERVTEISVNSITNQFEGQQSAYMLFYRRKDLIRPDSSFGNSMYKIPKHVVEQIQEENIKLQNWREDYEKASNRLDLYIHTENMCFVSNGLIQTSNPEGHLLQIDQRETVDDLLSKISQEQSTFFRRPKPKLKLKKKYEDSSLKPSTQCVNTLHYMKVLPHAGIHLYECTSVRKDVSLYEAGIQSQVHLFAWDGDKILGSNVAPGEENEPVLHHLICQHPDFTRRVSFSLPKSQPPDVIRERAAELMLTQQIEVKEMVQDEVDNLETEGNKEEYEMEKYVKNYVADIVRSEEENEIKESSVEAQEDTISVHVKVRNLGLHQSLKDVVTDFKVDKSMSVGCFTRLICSKLGVKKDEKYRISMLNEDQVVPLRNVDVLEDLELTEDQMLLLEEGENLAASELVLFVRKFNEPHCSEYVAQVNWKLKQLYEDMHKEFQLPDDEWHLRRCSCYGDMLGVLEPTDDEIPLKNGDYVMVSHGKLAEKGNIRMRVWLFPTLPDFKSKFKDFKHDQLVQGSVEDARRRRSKEVDASTIQNMKELKEIGPCNCGHIELKRDSTLYDLKRLLALKISKELQSEAAELRYRVLERSSLTRVIDKETTNEEVTLKRLKLSSSTQIAVQPAECKLQSNELLLTVVLHVPGTRCYTEEMELITEKAAPKLGQVFAEILNVVVDDLIIARKFVEKNEWTVIQTDDSNDSPTKTKPSKSGKRGKRLSGKRKSLKTQKESIQLKHGDVIGVKIKSLEEKSSFELDLIDFDTEEDIFMQKKLKEIKEKSQEFNKSHDGANDQVLDNDSNNAIKTVNAKNNKEKENTLKIHVDNFSESCNGLPTS
nr:ubiquitin carboxyl-terminal hydrolase 40 [Ciona intestinalis]|eukprot:XP_009857673.1 ubiquitin carboxyl-terminal hydrolase 40 [Ciona intestinalis]